MSNTGGFPQTQNNGSQVGALDNTMSLGSRINWEQTLGYVRMYLLQLLTTQTVPGGATSASAAAHPSETLYAAPGMPGLLIKEMATNSTVLLRLEGRSVQFICRHRLLPEPAESSRASCSSLGKHTILAGGGYSYTQLNIENNRDGIAQITSATFQKFLAGAVHSANVLETIDPQSGRNNADRYYRIERDLGLMSRTSGRRSRT